MKPFIWKSSNYIKKMESDMNFFLQSELLPDNISSNGVNPLLLEASPSDRASNTTSILPSLQRTYPRSSFISNNTPSSHGDTLLERLIHCEHIILKEGETSRKYEQSMQMLTFDDASSESHIRYQDQEKRVERMDRRSKERIRGQKSVGHIRHGSSVLDGLLAGWGVDNKNVRSNEISGAERRPARRRRREGSKMADTLVPLTEMKDGNGDKQFVLGLEHEKSLSREYREEANETKDLIQHQNTVANAIRSGSATCEHNFSDREELSPSENKGDIVDQAEQEDVEASHAAVMIQKQVKGFLARKQYQNLVKENEISAAALTLQKTFRGHLARKTAKQKRQTKHDREREKHAAVAIQKTYRGYFQKKQMQQNNKRKKKEEAALLIQKTFRGYFERQWIKKSQQVEYHASKPMLQQESAAMVVQRMYRGHHARKRLQIAKKEREKERKLFEKNVIKCQAVGRSYLAKKRVIMRRTEMGLDQFVKNEKCAIECQRFARGFLARKRIQRIHEEKRNIHKDSRTRNALDEGGKQSFLIDIVGNSVSLYREEARGVGFEEEIGGHREESQVQDETSNDQEIAGIKIQSLVRRYLARCRYRNFYQPAYESRVGQELKCERSVLLLQRNIRAFLGRLQFAKVAAKRNQEIEEYIKQERAAFGFSQA